MKKLNLEALNEFNPTWFFNDYIENIKTKNIEKVKSYWEFYIL